MLGLGIAGLGGPLDVLAEGSSADSSPGASPSHSLASASLATRQCWCCRLPRAPGPPAPDSGTSEPGREGGVSED